MNDFSHIPLTGSYSISFAGRILPDGIRIAEIDSETWVLIGTSDGELSLYLFDSEIPRKHASSLGGITIVDMRYFDFLGRTVAVVILLESLCLFFDLQGSDNEWNPFMSQNLIFNPSCYSIFPGKSGNEILLGTHQGGIGYFVENPPGAKQDQLWRYSNFWSLKYGVTAISYVKQETFIICRSDGNAFLFNIKDNPERLTEFIVEVQAKESSPIMLKYIPETDSVFGANGEGKIYSTLLKKKLEPLDIELKKRPIFIDYFREETGREIEVIGTPDGGLYFMTGKIRNIYRHEEPVQTYYISKTCKFILVIVGLSGVLSFYTQLRVFDHKIPRFSDFIKAELESLRKVIKDKDTPDEVFISTYLYMPLP